MNVPQFLSSAPWYAQTEGGAAPVNEPKDLYKKRDADFDNWYVRGAKAGPAATKYRKGSCEVFHTYLTSLILRIVAHLPTQ